jgi:hypothetical protein
MEKMTNYKYIDTSHPQFFKCMDLNLINARFSVDEIKKGLQTQ